MKIAKKFVQHSKEMMKGYKSLRNYLFIQNRILFIWQKIG